jgi:molybdopterin-synthase adenylyltransferase
MSDENHDRQHNPELEDDHHGWGRGFALPLDPNARPADIRIRQTDWDALLGHLLGDGREHAAMLVCGLRETSDTLTYLVRDLVLLTPSDYVDRGAVHLSVAPTTLARVAKRARLLDTAVIMTHSHPFPGSVVASGIDLRTEADLGRRVLTSRTEKPVGALVVGPDGLDGRSWTPAGAGPLSALTVIGDTLTRYAVTSHAVSPSQGAHSGDGTGADVATPSVAPAREGESATARQELLWGASGQQILLDSHVVVVGAGGTGSHVATQLAHLRVGRLTLIDHDVIEMSNLSRILGLGPDDVGRSKVEALADQLSRIHPGATIETYAASVLDIDPAILTAADVIVCATDGHGSRSLLNDLAHQYYVPVVDLGVEVVPGDAFRAGGGVRVLRPGSGCLWCAQTLSPALVREEYLSEFQRTQEAERGYLRGATAAAPSVIALNGVVASLAVMEVCQLLVGMLGAGRDRLLYRAEMRALSTTGMTPRAGCPVCGNEEESGKPVGKGDAARVKTRWRKVPAWGAQRLR